MRRRTRLSRGPPVTSITYFKIHITESEEADNLEVLKKTTAEEQAKLNKKKKKFRRALIGGKKLLPTSRTKNQHKMMLVEVS